MKIGTCRFSSRNTWITVALLSAATACGSDSEPGPLSPGDAASDPVVDSTVRPDGGSDAPNVDVAPDTRDAANTLDTRDASADVIVDRSVADGDANGGSEDVVDSFSDPVVDVPITAPAAFTVTGISGPADTTPDTWLMGTPTPTVTWQASTGAFGYDVTIYEEDGVTVKCAAQQVDGAATSASFASCALTEGLQYRASVAATAGTFRTTATNDKLRFAVGAVVFGQPDAKSNEGVRLGLALPNDVIFAGSRLIVADQNNSRVLIWNTIPTNNQQPADIVLGQPDLTTTSSNYGGIGPATFNGSNSVSSDGTKLVVGDRFNHRVLIWNTFPTKNNQPADVVVGQPNFATSTTNTGGISAKSLSEPWAWVCSGKLVVSDRDNHRVLIWNTIPTTNEASADVVLGQPDMVSSIVNNGGLDASSIADPGRGACDGTKLYVPDLANHRVLIWNTVPTVNDADANLLLGQMSIDLNQANRGEPVGPGGLNSPIAVYANGNVIAVADYLNNRVAVWTTAITGNGQDANLVLGQTSTAGSTANAGGVSASSLYNPNAVAGDGTRLAIADRFNHRIVMYPTMPSANGATATVFLGQPDSVGNRLNSGGPISASSLTAPSAITTLGTRLGIADGASRVLIWDTAPASRLNLPTMVLGQPNFTSSGQFGGATTSTSLCAPTGLHSDSSRLFVGEQCANRAIMWSPLPTSTQQPANLVLGQPNMTTATPHSGGVVSGSTMYGRQSPHSDGTHLFVADAGNHRILVWNAIPMTNGKAADTVLGQPEKNSNLPNSGGISEKSLLRPNFVYSSGGKVFVADTGNHRVLIWNTLPTVNQTAADIVLGQPNMTSNAAASVASAKTLLSPSTIHVDVSGRLYVSDAGNHRILYWNAIPTANETPADGVIGQPNLEASLANNGGLTARALQSPSGLLASGSLLYVLDSGNDRLLLMPRP